MTTADLDALEPQDDEASDEVILEALARMVGRDDAHACLIRALAGRVYVEQQDRYYWRAVAELRAAQMRDAGLGVAHRHADTWQLNLAANLAAAGMAKALYMLLIRSCMNANCDCPSGHMQRTMREAVS